MGLPTAIFFVPVPVIVYLEFYVNAQQPNANVYSGVTLFCGYSQKKVDYIGSFVNLCLPKLILAKWYYSMAAFDISKSIRSRNSKIEMYINHSGNGVNRNKKLS